MICNNCGNIVPDGQYTCNNCGAYIGTQQAQPVNQPNTYQMNSYGPQLGMKWYNFLIYFMLFFSCIANIWNGFKIFTGAHYDGSADLVYRYFDGLKTVDIIMGTLSVVLGVYALFVRFALAGYKKNGPLMFILIYVFSVIMNILYALMVTSVAVQFTFFDVYSPITMLTHAIMIWANYVYFKNRKHMFVN